MGGKERWKRKKKGGGGGKRKRKKKGGGRKVKKEGIEGIRNERKRLKWKEKSEKRKK